MGTKVWFYIDMQHAHDILPVYNYCKYASRQVQGCPFTPRIPSVALFLHDLNYFWTFYCCCFLNFLPLFIILLISIIFFRFLFIFFMRSFRIPMMMLIEIQKSTFSSWQWIALTIHTICIWTLTMLRLVRNSYELTWALVLHASHK